MKPRVKKIVKRCVRVSCWTLGVLVLLLVVSFALLNTHAVQNWLKDVAVEMLSKKLQTSVTVDDVSVEFFSHDVKLHGLHIQDQQQRKMLDMESLAADVSMLPLLSGEVRVTDVRLAGIEAHFYKSDSDSVANYQFLIDAFASDHEVESKGKKLKLNVSDVDVERVNLTYNDYALALDRLQVEMNGTYVGEAEVKGVNLTHISDTLTLEHLKAKLNDNALTDAEVKGVTAKLKHPNKKGVMISYLVNLDQFKLKMDGQRVTHAEVKDLAAKWRAPNRLNVMVDHQVQLEDFELKPDGKLWDAQIAKLHYASNNHKPRKHDTNPHHGYFDRGHLDITTDLNATLDYMSLDSLHGKVTRCVAVDKVNGIDVRDLRFGFAANRHRIHVNDVTLRQVDSRASFASGDIYLPDGVHDFSFKTSVIKVHAFLSNIAHAFAPDLAKFTMPVQATAVMSGTLEQINLIDVHLCTPDNHFQALASGTVRGFRYPEKHEIHAHIDVKQMTTTPGKVEEMLKQLPVKRFMMKQLHGLGTISYAGSFDVFWKKEQFRGTLKTQTGDIDFNFTVDGLNKYLTGSASTASLDAGKLLDMHKIGKASLSAEFKFDISGPRTAAMRRNRGGKLPIGEASAHVDEASYGILKVHDIDLSVKSDGVTAEGDLMAPHKFVDLSCSFSFTDTDDMNKLKVHPHVKLHK